MTNTIAVNCLLLTPVLYSMEIKIQRQETKIITLFHEMPVGSRDYDYGKYPLLPE
jgi:hypothetical protein